MEANTWQNPERPIFAAPFEAPGTAGCDQLEFSPALEAKPSTNLADSPSGLDLHLHIPQISDPEGSASAQLRSARLELPAGLAVNPAAANGLGSCTPSEIGLSIPASERQLLRYDLPPINFPGSFVVTRGGQSTPPISSTASRAEVDAALESLPGMAGNVTVGGAPGGWIVEFTGALAATDVPLLSGTVTDNPSQKIAVTAEGGTYRLETAGQSTTELPFDASASEIQAALRALPSLGLGNLYPGNVFVKSLGSEETTRLYQVVFAEDLNGAEPSLGASSSLTGTGSGVTISRLSSPSQRSLSVVSFRGNAPGTPQFDSAPANCPDTSKLGTVRVDSPEFLDHPLFGSVYLATPGENPFGSLLALYLIVEDPASDIVVKLPARVESDPSTGGLLATLAEAPQLPFEDLTIELFKGSAAPLRTPPNCGVFNVGSELTPWSAPDGARRRPQDSFAIEQGAGAGTCPSDPAAVPDLTRFSAGTLDPSAGTETPFLLKLSRPDGGRALSGIDTTLPPGLLARIAGLAPCPDSALARATSRSGTAEQSDPSCPASSRVGGLDLAAGAGPNPYNLSGAAYLAGPYRGAPVSLALITPVLAGPFDLGTVLTRVALSVDPRTTRVHAVSDPLPSSLDGLPFDLRSVSLHLGSAFARNPTSCYPLAFSGADPRQSTRFQVGDCRRLAFKPKLQIGAKGPVKAGSDPAISASLTNPGERLPANLAAADLLLPRTLRLDRRHLRSPGAVYGDVSATTPLLSEPLKGAVTLGRATSKSVQLNLALHGQFDVDLEGYLQVQKGGTLRVSFDQLPDVPLTKFTLALAGGKQGLIEATRNLCSASSSIAAELTGQNAATYDSKLALRVPCPKKGKQAKSKRGGGSR
jgi:hypothetical protein